jgi:hypothetical protein
MSTTPTSRADIVVASLELDGEIEPGVVAGAVGPALTVGRELESSRLLTTNPVMANSRATTTAVTATTGPRDRRPWPPGSMGDRPAGSGGGHGERGGDGGRSGSIVGVQ